MNVSPPSSSSVNGELQRCGVYPHQLSCYIHCCSYVLVMSAVFSRQEIYFKSDFPELFTNIV